MKPLRGRLLAELIPQDGMLRDSGLLLINRKDIATKARVTALGDDSMSTKGKRLTSPAFIGDIVHFKQYKPMTHTKTKEGRKTGLVTIWFMDIILIEEKV